MELFDLSYDVIRQIMIFYIDNSKVNQKKIEFIGSRLLNEISENININEPIIFELIIENKLNKIQLINKEDVEYVDKYGNTTLMWACWCRVTDVALKILDMSDSCNIIKPEQINKDGDTALIIACRNKMTEVSLKLLDMDDIRKPEQITIYGETALSYAYQNEMPEVIKKIHELG
jgi:ankyrin repeat protein